MASDYSRGMPEQQHWIYRVLRLVTKDEVKTPLSFLHKVVPYLVAASVVILYAPVSDDLKESLIYFVYGSLIFLTLLMMGFAWCRPKYLVYGESGHRAEYKIEFGTDTGIRTREELDALPTSSDPRLPKLEDKT